MFGLDLQTYLRGFIAAINGKNVMTIKGHEVVYKDQSEPTCWLVSIDGVDFKFNSHTGSLYDMNDKYLMHSEEYLNQAPKTVSEADEYIGPVKLAKEMAKAQVRNRKMRRAARAAVAQSVAKNPEFTYWNVIKAQARQDIDWMSRYNAAWMTEFKAINGQEFHAWVRANCS